MSEPGAKAASPYKYCEAHFVPNCPICMGQQPNPVSGDKLVVVVPPIMPAEPQETAKSAPVAPPVTPKPEFTDPKALAVTEAASRLAHAREALVLVREQLGNVAQAIETLKKKELEAIEEQTKAQEDLMKSMGEMNAKS